MLPIHLEPALCGGPCRGGGPGGPRRVARLHLQVAQHLARVLAHLRRAGLEPDAIYSIYRFRVRRYIEASGKYQPAVS